MPTTTSAAKNTAGPNDPVAVAAYLDWISAGKPHGRDHEFWLRAEQRILNGKPKAGKSSARKAPNASQAK